jgi:hypothetical protein
MVKVLGVFSYFRGFPDDTRMVKCGFLQEFYIRTQSLPTGQRLHIAHLTCLDDEDFDICQTIGYVQYSIEHRIMHKVQKPRNPRLQ